MVLEFSLRDKKCIKQGEIWNTSLSGGKAYKVTKQKSTASSLSSFPPHQQGRSVAYNSRFGHVAVSNNYGDVSILDYNNLANLLQSITKPKEWNEVMVYSPDNNYLAIGSHDNGVYVYKVSE
mmetsp:Transcript_14405/g.24550  ORF Transcript_14405/g.24550 Transcript_14405/m.24550 type:complete len:122 (-) Transcript_14405:551-916(-)